jgi:hypothetical protein
MADFVISFKVENLEITTTRYRRAPLVLDDLIEKNFRALGIVIAAKMRRVVAPVKYTGALERSISSQFEFAPPRFVLEIGPTAPHASIVRTGTRPHWAPIDVLKRWARWKLGDEKAAYAVQRSIAYYGTSRYLAQRGIAGAEQTSFGIGLNFVRVTRERGDVQQGVTRTARRIQMNLARFLNTGVQAGVTMTGGEA